MSLLNTAPEKEFAQFSSPQALKICLAVNLPDIEEEKVNKIIQIFQNKKTVSELKKEIEDTKNSLPFSMPQTNDLTADILLETMTADAAVKHLRILKNIETINKFQSALKFSDSVRDTLINYYAAPASLFNFDEEMSNALQHTEYKTVQTPQCAQQAVNLLEDKAANYPHNHAPQNQNDIEDYALKYSLSMHHAAEFFDIYTKPGARSFKADFDQTYASLLTPGNEKIATYLTSCTLCSKITLQDALNFSALAAALPYKITKEDLFMLGMRYLKFQKPAEIHATLDALLKRMPFHEIKEENLGLALSILNDPTPEKLESSIAKAQKNKDTAVFRKALSRYECFDGFTNDIARKFAGAIQLKELLSKFNDSAAVLPHCMSSAENNDLACKVLLGKITQEEASSQAAYRRDLKARTLTEGLAPEVLKKYLGTMAPQDLMDFFNRELAPYSFWKSDSEKLLYALEALVSQLNGTTSSEVTEFVLTSLEADKSIADVSSRISQIPAGEKSKITASQLGGEFGAKPNGDKGGFSSIFDS